MLYNSEKGDFSIALTGDSMLTRRLSLFGEEGYSALVNLLKGADAAFTNLETTVHRWDEGSPGITQGTFMTTDPRLLAELQWLGIRIVSCANNHAFDYGEGGVLATIRHLDEAGVSHAGSGRNLAEARAPGYLDTPGGRVALIAATATYRPWNKAGEQRPDLKGRPGINPLGFQTIYSVDPVAFQELRRASAGLGLDVGKERNRGHFYSTREIPDEKEEEMEFLGHRFVQSQGFSVSTKVNQRDLDENLRSVREARRQGDWVLVSLHSHEFGGETLLKARKRTELDEPAGFVKEFAHQAIDAGADIFAGHGSHFPLGIEIYKGKPIIYSLGNFIFQNETVGFFPSDAYERFDLDSKATPADFLDARTDGGRKGHVSDPLYWENIAVVCSFRERKLAEIRLYPVDLGYGRPRAQRGRPVLADERVGGRIIERLQHVCHRYGTTVTQRNGVGIITV